MPVGTLVIRLSQGDPRISEQQFAAINSLNDVNVFHYWRGQNLGSYDGDSQAPLVLVAHAVGNTFTTRCSAQGNFIQARERVNGPRIATTLLQRGLRTDTFSFCLIAGCKAASQQSLSGLYVDIGSRLGLPVVASTTAVNLSINEQVLTASSTAGGIWSVFFPQRQNDDEIAQEAMIEELGSERCESIRNTLANLQHWLCVN